MCLVNISGYDRQHEAAALVAKAWRNDRVHSVKELMDVASLNGAKALRLKRQD